jgi:DNA-binding beta-propeller fold protein YncE
MKTINSAITKILTISACLLGAGMLGLTTAVHASDDTDSMFIGDGADNTVKRFDAISGAPEGAFVAPSSGGLFGPRGLVFAGRHLLVVNQNVDQPFSGEVLDYDKTGAFLKARVPSSDPKAPFAPRGMVRGHGNLYVADMGDAGYVIGGGAAPNPLPARVAQYDQRTGAWERDLNYAEFAMNCSATNECVQWSPRGAVFGPDGALYVSAQKFVTATNPNTLFGRIIRFSKGGRGEGKVLVDGETCGCGLARPEGLTFGPDGRLYVTSFRISVNDNDKILIFRRNGTFRGKIDLDQVGEPRAFAQAIAFGPGGNLYVPINGNGPDAGSVRRYDVSTGTFDTVVAAGGELIAPWYITFGQTNSATLAYDGD